MSINWLGATSALALSAIWIGVCFGVLVVGTPDKPFLIAPGTLTIAFVWVAPVILIWLACATIAFSVQTDHRLWHLESQIHSVRSGQASKDDIRSQVAGGAGLAVTEVLPEPEPEAVVESPGQDDVLNPVEIEPLPRTGQRTGISKALEEEEEDAVISNSLIIRALNFAEDENDVLGIAAVDTAAQDQDIAGLLRSSIRMLQTLVDAGISIDHLHLSFAPPDEWKEKLAGSSDSEVAELYTISDHHYVLTAGRLIRNDTEIGENARSFRLGAREFLERFVRDAEDDEVAALLNTRTFRAFLLLEHAAV